MIKKLLSLIMAGVITITFSMSAVAEENFIDEVVTGEAAIEEYANGLLYEDEHEHVFIEEHENDIAVDIYDYIEITDNYSLITPTAVCPPHYYNSTGAISSTWIAGGKHQYVVSYLNDEPYEYGSCEYAYYDKYELTKCVCGASGPSIYRGQSQTHSKCGA